MTDASEPHDTGPGADVASDEPGDARPEHDAPAAPAADVVEPPLDVPLDDTTARLRALEQERDTFLDHLRRERAEFENYRRRSTREQAEAFDRGAEALTSQLLGVLDNFGYVLEAAKDHDDAVAKGVRMVHTELRDVLGRAGLEEVPGVGSSFDPTVHDAVMQVEGDTDEDGEPVVAQVLRTGYRFKGRVLRPASVAVTQP